MKITIEIECETISEFKGHCLCMLEQAIRFHVKHEVDDSDDLTKGFVDSLYDNNCYGTHEVTVKAEEAWPTKPTHPSSVRKSSTGT